MKKEELIELLHEVNAKREEGYNCAEGVFWGLSQVLDLDAPISAVTGFGGGVAGTGSVCGALSGVVTALGIYVGRTEPDDIEGKNKAMKLSRKVNDGFVEQMGTQLCKEILGHMPGSQPKKPIKGINPKCIQAVTVAIEQALSVIEETDMEE